MRGSSITAYMVERYWPGVTVGRLTAAMSRAATVAGQMAREGVGISYVQSLLVPEEEAVFCLFMAPSAAAVTELNRRAEIPFDRISKVIRLTPDRGEADQAGAATPPPTSIA